MYGPGAPEYGVPPVEVMVILPLVPLLQDGDTNEFVLEKTGGSVKVTTALVDAEPLETETV